MWIGGLVVNSVVYFGSLFLYISLVCVFGVGDLLFIAWWTYCVGVLVLILGCCASEFVCLGCGGVACCGWFMFGGFCFIVVLRLGLGLLFVCLIGWCLAVLAVVGWCWGCFLGGRLPLDFCWFGDDLIIAARWFGLLLVVLCFAMIWLLDAFGVCCF